MKLKIFLICLLTCIIVCCSCTDSMQNKLNYQNYPLNINGILTVDSMNCSVTLTMKDRKTGEVTIDSPERLKGYRFSVDKENVWVYYDDIEIPMPKESMGRGILTLIEMFSLNEDSLEEIIPCEIDSAKHTCLVYKTGNLSVSVYLKDRQNLPTRIEAKGENTNTVFEINTAEVKEKS